MTDHQYGPQTTQIKALIRRAARLTPAQQAALADGDEDVTTFLFMARYAYTDAVSSRYDDLAEAKQEAAALAESELAVATQYYDEAVWRTLEDGIHALQVRHMRGEGLFQQRHYDALTARAARVLGPLHPDDPGGPLTTHTLIRVTRTIVQQVWVDTDALLEESGGKLPAPGEDIPIDEPWHLVSDWDLDNPRTHAELWDADLTVSQMGEWVYREQLGPWVGPVLGGAS